MFIIRITKEYLRIIFVTFLRIARCRPDCTCYKNSVVITYGVNNWLTRYNAFLTFVVFHCSPILRYSSVIMGGRAEGELRGAMGPPPFIANMHFSASSVRTTKQTIQNTD